MTLVKAENHDKNHFHIKYRGIVLAKHKHVRLNGLSKADVYLKKA